VSSHVASGRASTSASRAEGGRARKRSFCRRGLGHRKRAGRGAPEHWTGPQHRMTELRLVVVTGLSGSGKSTAIKVLEDLGFYCIDNLRWRSSPLRRGVGELE